MSDPTLRRQARADLAGGAALFVVAIVGTVSLVANDALWSGEFGRDPGPGLLPAILVALLAVGSLGLIGAGTVGLLRSRGASTPLTPPRIFVVPALMAGSLGVYLWALAPLGFLEATTAFALLWIVLLGIQDDGAPNAGRLALYAAEAVAVVAAVWIVFVELILVPLP